jgi:GTP-binding protein
LKTKALERFPTEEARPGDIVAVAGIEEITIGETLADPNDIRPLPMITVDDPAISMTIGINTSPMAGRVKGAKVTARLVKDRLDKELIGNVSIRVLPTERPDAWEVQGRGELALAILVEQMRREGYELTVGKPQVVTKRVDGKLHEPVEDLTIDGVPCAKPWLDWFPHRVLDQHQGHRNCQRNLSWLRAMGRRNQHPQQRFANC